jgi:hypothetical protein
MVSGECNGYSGCLLWRVANYFVVHAQISSTHDKVELLMCELG